MNRYWAWVVIAGLIEVLWAMGLKHSTNLISWAGTFFLIILSFVILIQATKKVPVATAYAVFTGIGTAGTSLVDIIFFGEPFSWTKILFLLLLLIGVLGLKLVTAETGGKEGGV
ncbi:paired small multidrug resistance pump [Anoxybacillus tepidamans]|uniref:Paired small multidrug resistance pump n=1 Tax=Anoxybacteroides tepidamans TaxID=265948 RepID=A0A7W8IUD6_9BACL|nr:multidrug efflux SMR transporter [Anoxybacillus tepidamans]MBB5325972.1 paired small multidrug resistance pump [Anoxybacillus tepidamans]